MCTTPIHVTASQLISSEIFPLPVVKALLYPGAIVNGLATDMSFPSWNNLLSIYNLTHIKEASADVDLQRLEVRIVLSFFPPYFWTLSLNKLHISAYFEHLCINHCYAVLSAFESIFFQYTRFLLEVTFAWLGPSLAS